MYLSELHALHAMTPAQHAQCQNQLLVLMAQLNQENYQWSLAQSYGESPPSSDQHNLTVMQLQAQIAQAQACLAQPVVQPPPAPAPAPRPPAPTPRASPAPAPAPAGAPPIVPTAGTGGSGGLIPTTEVEVQTFSGEPGSGTITGGAAPADDKGNGGLILLLLGGAAALMGGS